jgi:hypothetical protein
MSDPIVEQALKAVQALTAGRPDSAPMPVITEKNHDPVTPIPREAVGGGGQLVTTHKGTGYLGVDDEPAGSALNPIAQLGLFSKIRRESAWLRFTTFRPVSENTGFLDLWDDRNFRMHPTATEGPRRNIPLHKPDVSQNNFATNTLSGAFGLRLKSIRTAAKAGQNVNRLVQQGIASGIANVLADIGMNGNVDLPDDSDINKQRRVRNGWFQRLRNSSPNYQGLADGFSYHNGIWAGMLHQLDKPYRSDRGLAWGLTDTVASRWLTELSALGVSPANSHPSIVHDLGVSLLNQLGQQANPLGKPGVVVPQILDDSFGSDEGYAGVAPTSVTNNGDGTLNIRVNTLVGAVDRGATGPDGQRFVTVGRITTGVEETLGIAFAGGNNDVITTTLLGQSNPSTTAADYYVKYADMQSLFLGIWRYLVLIVQNGMRIYTVFYPHDEVIEVIVHADIDYLVADDEATSLVDDVITPQFSVFP